MDSLPSAAVLRKQAEARLLNRSAESDLPLSIEDAHRLVHELEVHQVELEMQNEELRQTRDAMDVTLEKYTDLFDFAPVGYFTLNRSGEILVLNLSGSILLGVERSQLIGRNFVRFITTEDQSYISDFIDNIFTTRKKLTCETRLTRQSNSPLTIHISAIADSSGSECRITVTDITALKNAEKALRESEKLYRAIGEANDYGIWVCDPDGRNIYASQSFLKMVGITQEQCSDFGWGDLLHPDDAENTMAAWKECVRTRGKWNIEHRFIGADGNWHPVLARGVPITNEFDEIIYWAGINLDISQIKQTQEALRQSEELSSKTL